MSHDILEALSRLAPRLGGAGACLSEAQRLSGGASMETWAFALTGPAGCRDFVLRRRVTPLDEKNSTAATLADEAAVIVAARQAGVPVPALAHLADPDDGLGEAHITERIPGESLGRKVVNDPRFEAVRPRLAAQCGDILAHIHGTPPPTGLRTRDAAAELDNYEGFYRASGAQRPVLELAIQHLRRRLPEPVEPVLVHGDFRNGNLIVDGATGIVAVLDWELIHLGDPAEDLGWLCVNSWRFGRSDRPVGGFGDYQDLLDAYAQAGGQQIPLSRLLFWQALGSLKWGVMCLRMYGFYASGADASLERPLIGRRTSEAESDLLRMLESGL